MQSAQSVLGAANGTEQVPTVPFNIEENRQLSIRLDARGGDEPHAGSDHPRVHGLEIVDAEEETHPARELLADDRRLMLAIGARQKNAGAAA